MTASFGARLAAEINARVAATLREPGLMPAWLPDLVLERDSDGISATSERHETAIALQPEVVALVDAPEPLADLPFRDWPAELRALWQLGLVYLRDRSSRVCSSARLDQSVGLILRRSRLDHFTTVRSGPVLLRDTLIGPHTSLVGPVVLERTTLAMHNYVGRNVLVEDSFFASYAKAQCLVRVRKSMVSAYAGLDGGNHPEQYPLSADGAVPEGVDVGADNWLGHHTALLAGARTGDGIVLGAGAVAARELGSHLLLLGAPARAFPIDFHLRGQTAEAAFRAGLNQGRDAAALPVYGPPVARLVDDRTLAIEYPEHGLKRDLSSPRLVDFQRGALTALLQDLEIGALASCDVRLEPTVQLVFSTVEPIRRVTLLTAETQLALRADHPRDDEEGPLAAVADHLRRGATTFGELVAAAERGELGAWAAGWLVADELTDAILGLAARGAFHTRVMVLSLERPDRLAPILTALGVPKPRADG